MSDEPSGPGARPKRSVRASQEKDGLVSPAFVFTFEPSLTGVDQAVLTLARVDAQMSWPPGAPARSELKTISSPSRRMFGWMSFAAEFSSATGVAGPKPPAPSWVT